MKFNNYSVQNYLKIDHESIDNKYLSTNKPLSTYVIQEFNDIDNFLGTNINNIYTQIFGKKDQRIQPVTHIDRYNSVISSFLNDLNKRCSSVTQEKKNKLIYSYLTRLIPIVVTYINRLILPIEKEYNDFEPNGIEFDRSLISVDVIVEKIIEKGIADVINETTYERTRYDIHFKYQFDKEYYMDTIGVIPNTISLDIASLGISDIINKLINFKLFIAPTSVYQIVSQILSEVANTVLCYNFVNIYNTYNTDNRLNMDDCSAIYLRLDCEETNCGFIELNFGIKTYVKPNFYWLEELEKNHNKSIDLTVNCFGKSFHTKEDKEDGN